MLKGGNRPGIRDYETCDVRSVHTSSDDFLALAMEIASESFSEA